MEGVRREVYVSGVEVIGKTTQPVTIRLVVEDYSGRILEALVTTRSANGQPKESRQA